MIVGDRFRLIANKDISKRMNFEIIKKGVEVKEKKGYLCADEDNHMRFFSYSQFHMLKTNGTIELITKDGVEL